MPNYTKLEQDMLTAEQRRLTDNSRGAALAALDDQSLLALIADLEDAARMAGPAGKDGQVSQRTLLSAALRRATAQRRKRKLAPPAVSSVASDPARPAGSAASRPAAAPKPARRAPASPARKPVGREKAEVRKPDLRTGSRRIAKAKPDKAETISPTDPKAPAKPRAAKPRIATGTSGTRPANPLGDTSKAAAPATSDARTVSKAERKAAKEAEKEVRKATRKAERKAAKLAEKTARQADKAARKAAEKAARKADAKAGGKAGKAKPGKAKARRSDDP